MSEPAVDRQGLNALARLDVVFRPGVFVGDAFPGCDFTDPAAAAELIGPYALRPAFYDAEHRPVERPTGPGRYGAVVEVVGPAGVTIPSRLVTLYRRAEGESCPAWGGAGVAEWVELVEADVPLLAAALAESKPGDPPPAGRNSIWARNERWWYPLKRRLGRARYAYRVDLPPGYDEPGAGVVPVLLYLHGSGERGDDLEMVRNSGPTASARAGCGLPFLIVSPQCPAGESWSAPQLRDLLDEVAGAYRVDADRVCVTGLSMGGYGVWELAAEYPGRFAAIVPICGGGGPADAGRLKDVPAWVFHGERDREVPFARSAEMVAALKAVGGRVRFTAYPDLGHDCWTAAYGDPELYEWLLRQRRGAAAGPGSEA